MHQGLGCPRHYEIWKYWQITSKAHAKVLPNLIVHGVIVSWAAFGSTQGTFALGQDAINAGKGSCAAFDFTRERRMCCSPAPFNVHDKTPSLVLQRTPFCDSPEEPFLSLFTMALQGRELSQGHWGLCYRTIGLIHLSSGARRCLVPSNVLLHLNPGE